MDVRRSTQKQPTRLMTDFPPDGEVIELHSAITESTAGSQLLPPTPCLPSPRPLGRQNYPGAGAGEFSERLVVPGGLNQMRHYQDSPPATPSFISRRSSWSSVGSRDRRLGPFASAKDARAASREEEDVNTQTIAQHYNITPTPDLILFPEDPEDDDDLHRPGPADKKRDCHICNVRGMTNMTALSCLTLGWSFRICLVVNELTL